MYPKTSYTSSVACLAVPCERFSNGLPHTALAQSYTILEHHGIAETCMAEYPNPIALAHWRSTSTLNAATQYSNMYMNILTGSLCIILHYATYHRVPLPSSSSFLRKGSTLSPSQLMTLVNSIGFQRISTANFSPARTTKACRSSSSLSTMSPWPRPKPCPTSSKLAIILCVAPISVLCCWIRLSISGALWPSEFHPVDWSVLRWLDLETGQLLGSVEMRRAYVCLHDQALQGVVEARST